MTDVQIGDRVTYRGRWYEVFGTSPMSVDPPYVILRHPQAPVYVRASPEELRVVARNVHRRRRRWWRQA
jgi:hypothetical protein